MAAASAVRTGILKPQQLRVSPARRPRPAARMLSAAFTSLSWTEPHASHCHSLIPRPAIPLGLDCGRWPLLEQVWDEYASSTSMGSAHAEFFNTIGRMKFIFGGSSRPKAVIARSKKRTFNVKNHRTEASAACGRSGGLVCWASLHIANTSRSTSLHRAIGS